ncbi:MAG: 8-oxo-dGTP diphosphatase [Erysipelotrichaceae bacterium]|nr:8-oxo-dGTP diphosphatase [Erysipelotrichaceae bacterium]
MANKIVNTVTCYLIRGDEFLLLYRNKKKNDFNHGKYIGVGSHIEKGETPEMAIDREVKEETNFDIVSKELRALIIFYFDEFIEHMYLYTSKEFKGEMKECNEGTLEWVDYHNFSKIPMWEGDKYFIKPLLNNEPYFEMSFLYEKDKLIEVKRLK